MKKKLAQFLNDAFAPYGDFPAKEDVVQELLANLQEKYEDFKKQGMNDEGAYKATIESFGDVEEIMEQVPHSEKASTARSTFRDTISEKLRKLNGVRSKFKHTVLTQADLSDSNLQGGDFTASALAEANFDSSNLRNAIFKASALRSASFVGADLSEARFL